MLAAGIEAEVSIFIERYGSLETVEGIAMMVRNGKVSQMHENVLYDYTKT